MELIKQTADLLAAAAPAGNLSQTGKAGKAEPGREDKDFDAMLRQKSQETGRDQKAGTAQKDGEAAQKGEPKAEEKKLQQAEDAGEEQPAEAQQLLAAALLYQRPVEVVEQPVQTEEAAVQTAAEVLADAAPVQEVQAQLPGGAQPQGEAQKPVQPQGETQKPVQPQAAVPERETPQAAVPEQEAAPQTMEVKVVEASQTAAEAPAEEAAPQQAQPQDGLKQTAAPADRPVQEAEAEKAPEDAPETAAPEQAALVKETPVKAPEKAPEGTVELEAPEGPSTLANMLKGALDKGESLCVIQFKPENLGVVQVTFSRNKDGALQILMEAANPKTAALLQKNSADIQNILAETLQGETRLEVRQSNMLFPDQWDGHQQQQQQQNQEQRREREKKDLDDFMHRLRLGLTGLDGED